MRVIAGELGGRRLKSVPGKQTRPTSDKIKEAVFQMMGPFFQGGTCLDLFAGSGSLGIEAISRGMESVVFVDKLGKAIHTIDKNLKDLKLEEQSKVMQMDALRALRVTAKHHACFDLILIDPPYGKMNYEKLLIEIMRLRLLKENGIIFCEHDISEKLPQTNKDLTIIKQANYGGMTGVTLYTT